MDVEKPVPKDNEVLIKVRAASAKTAIRELMAAGTVKPVIDKHYRLTEAAEALGYLEKGHARGKVVTDLGSSDKA